MIKYDKKHFERELDRMVKDIGIDTRDTIREELQNLPTKTKDYTNSLSKIEYDEVGKFVYSKDWGVGALNQGRLPGKFPNINRIRTWVRDFKDGGANKYLPAHEINQIAFKVGKHIKEKGLKAHWYVDRALERMSSW